MVIPAAGRGRRFGSPENKIWAILGGRSVLERTLAAFSTHPAINHIVIVAGEDELDRVREAAAACAHATPPKPTPHRPEGAWSETTPPQPSPQAGRELASPRERKGILPRVPSGRCGGIEGGPVIDVVAGGETCSASVLNGLNALPDDIEIVLVHDAARPLVSAALIDRVIAATLRTGAAVPGLPLSDTVKRVDAQGQVRATIPRTATIDGLPISGLTAVQTPQGALLANLRRAYSQFDFAAAEPTDEASLIEAAGLPVEIAPGDPDNIKITRQEDLALAERLLTANDGTLSADYADFTDKGSVPADEATARPHPPTPLAEAERGAIHTLTLSPSHPITPSPSHAREARTGFGYDVHAFAAPGAGRKLFLGGVKIPHDRGLEGHSDADVLLHAVCDALLGALSLGDIGILFPNTDEAYRGISSLRLLEIVAARVRDAGWQTVNIDATVVAEAPKLMPHRLRMQEAIAACLAITADRVSVKATTSEGLGFVGRREGMAAWAVATVRQLTAV